MRVFAAISGLFLLLCGLIAADLNTNSASRRLPLLPVPPKRMPSFRELFKMNSADRAVELAKKSPTHRAIIEGRLKELDTLPPDQQEVRLRLMELRLRLISLVREAPINRTNVLDQVPPQDRKLVEERLRYWDQLPLELQKVVLENEMMLSYFISGEAANASELTNRLDTLPPNVRSNLVATMERWRRLKPEEQKQIYQNVERVFGLSEKDRQDIVSDRALDGCSIEERQRIARVFKTFEILSPDQQRQCMESLRKFTSMTMEERARFLKNAERWQQMSEAERQNWRRLQKQSPPTPPLPPGVHLNPASENLSAKTN